MRCANDERPAMLAAGDLWATVATILRATLAQ